MLYRQVECFLTVAKLGSMSRAAEQMYLTQPSLTARIKGLEDELGDQLFVRSKSGMRLTEAGSEFLPYAERCVASIDNGKQRLRELREGTSGHLRLGALPRVSTYTLPPILQEFTSTHPGVSISVHTGHSTEVLEMVLREEVQIGLARALCNPEIVNLPLYEESLVLAVHPQHRFANKERVNLADLEQEHLILFDRASSNFELTKALFQGEGVQEPKMIELDNIEAAKRMVEHRLGVSLLPRQAVTRAEKAGRLCVLEVVSDDGPSLQRHIAAMRRQDVPLTGPVLAFLKTVDLMNHTLGKV